MLHLLYIYLIIYTSKKSLFCQSDAHRTYGDEALLVEVANGTLVNLLAHVETLVDVVGLALVAKVALAVVVQEILVEGFGEIGSLLDAGLLQGDIFPSGRTLPMYPFILSPVWMYWKIWS